MSTSQNIQRRPSVPRTPLITSPAYNKNASFSELFQQAQMTQSQMGFQTQESPPKKQPYVIPINHLRQPINKEKYQRNLDYFNMNFPQVRRLKHRNSTGDACKMANKAPYLPLRRQTRVIKEEAVDHLNRVRFYSTSKKKKAPTDRNSFMEVVHSKIKNPVNIKRIDSIYERTQRQEDPDRVYEPQWVEQEDGPIKKFGPWEELWKDKVKRFSQKSQYSHFPSYKLRNCIVKGGDDLRQ